MRLSIILPALLFVSACSQRAPWVTVPGPDRAATSSGSSGNAGSRSGGGASASRRPTLSTVVAVPSAEEAALLASLGSLTFPVAGMNGSGVADSFWDARDGGDRRHHAIDIMAPRGTPVLSVQDGRILRLSTSAKGGITVFAVDATERFVFYYAHLDGYHPGLHDGRQIARGDTLGYVGTTGNAPPSVPHLHFQLMRMPSDGRYWDGVPLNPYTLLRAPEAAWR